MEKRGGEEGWKSGVGLRVSEWGVRGGEGWCQGRRERRERGDEEEEWIGGRDGKRDEQH